MASVLSVGSRHLSVINEISATSCSSRLRKKNAGLQRVNIQTEASNSEIAAPDNVWVPAAKGVPVRMLPELLRLWVSNS